MKKKWKQIVSPQLRVVFICICYMLVALLIIGVFFSAALYNNTYSNASKLIEAETTKNIETIDNSFSFVTNMAFAVASSEGILKWVDNTDYFNSENPSYFDNIYKLKKEMQHILTYSNAWKSNYIEFVCVTLGNELLVQVSPKSLTNSQVKQIISKVYTRLMENQDTYVQELAPFVDDSTIYHARMLKRKNKSDIPLIVLVGTSESVLRQQYANSEFAGNDYMMIVDNNWNVFSSNKKELIGSSLNGSIVQQLEENKRFVSIDGKQHLSFSGPMLKSNLKMVALADTNNIVRNVWLQVITFAAIAVIIILFLIIFGYYISFNSTKFIKDLAEGMKQIQKENYDVRMPSYGVGQIDELGNAFNSMAKSMKTLIVDNYEASILRNEMELEFIQQQMNPHFLINILLIIQIKAKLCEDETIYNMITSLTGFLRASIFSNRNLMTSLRDELKCAQFYLYLQQQRYEGRLSYEIHADEDVLETILPRLTIEPLVENSIIHSTEAQIEMTKIIITARRKKGFVEISIQDNGLGFDVSKLNLDNKIASPDTREKIGLKNTNSRLISLYGKEYALEINSEIGAGTSITIRIPVAEHMEKEEL